MLAHNFREYLGPRVLIKSDAVVELLKQKVSFRPEGVEFGIGEEAFGRGARLEVFLYEVLAWVQAAAVHPSKHLETRVRAD